MDLRNAIRSRADFPRKGATYRDISPLLNDAAVFKAAIETLAGALRGKGVTKIAGIESRGYVLGGALAMQLGAGFLPIRMYGKLPGPAMSRPYRKLGGEQHAEILLDAVKAGDKVAVVDDCLNTGISAETACLLVRDLGGTVVGAGFIAEIRPSGGRARLEAIGVPVTTAIAYDE
jgi:adenine phosphoribosyltransferase